MKKIILSASLILALLLAGCDNTEIVTENSNYVITRDESGCYLEITPTRDELYDANVEKMLAISYPKYTTVSEMREGMLSGNLGDRELFALQRLERAAEARGECFYICDPDDLYELEYPKDGSTRLSHILWKGSTVSYELRGDIRGYFVSNLSVADYNSYYEARFSGVPSIGFDGKQSNTSERDATVYEHETMSGRFRKIIYTIEIKDTEMLISEHYGLEYVDGVNKIASDSVPRWIDILGKTNGTYFYGYLRNFEERPSVEWLSEFGYVPYVE